MTEQTNQAGQAPMGFETFLASALTQGFESNDRAMRQWADHTARELGKGLLFLFANREDLAVDVRQTLPSAMHTFFERLPRWVKFDDLPYFAEELQELPAETRDIVEAHIHYVDLTNINALPPGTTPGYSPAEAWQSALSVLETDT
ncbi:MAG: hypothetical protein JWS12_513 [Candidatus Saccharibacteria bacterium]|nr:hypothetical protein [Candidatus Saccharibacteria bacterium]